MAIKSIMGQNISTPAGSSIVTGGSLDSLWLTLQSGSYSDGDLFHNTASNGDMYVARLTSEAFGGVLIPTWIDKNYSSISLAPNLSGGNSYFTRTMSTATINSSFTFNGPGTLSKEIDDGVSWTAPSSGGGSTTTSLGYFIASGSHDFGKSLFIVRVRDLANYYNQRQDRIGIYTFHGSNRYTTLAKLSYNSVGRLHWGNFSSAISTINQCGDAIEQETNDINLIQDAWIYILADPTSANAPQIVKVDGDRSFAAVDRSYLGYSNAATDAVFYIAQASYSFTVNNFHIQQAYGLVLS